jgi:hypothetical protein
MANAAQTAGFGEVTAFRLRSNDGGGRCDGLDFPPILSALIPICILHSLARPKGGDFLIHSPGQFIFPLENSDRPNQRPRSEKNHKGAWLVETHGSALDRRTAPLQLRQGRSEAALASSLSSSGTRHRTLSPALAQRRSTVAPILTRRRSRSACNVAVLFSGLTMDESLGRHPFVIVRIGCEACVPGRVPTAWHGWRRVRGRDYPPGPPERLTVDCQFQKPPVPPGLGTPLHPGS